MHRAPSLLTLVIAVAAVSLVSCGGESPASPSGAGGVTVEGVLLGESAAFTSSSSGNSSDGPITVEVVGTELSVTISGNGTFKIEDIPEGGITLRFIQDGTVLSEISIPYSPDGTTVKIVVKKEGSVIVLIDLKLEDDDDDDSDDSASGSCMIDGGREGDRIELEGDVLSGGGEAFEMTTNRASKPVHVDASNADFKCNGNTAGDRECHEAVEPGAKVHVRGTLKECGSGSAEVTATQVKVQKAASS
ncbi:MAG: hypothetical protein LJF30_23395 [Acidobacteria bacterium]|nr:hypothetical protein [Acidobacteriota bacterium]